MSISEVKQVLEFIEALDEFGLVHSSYSEDLNLTIRKLRDFIKEIEKNEPVAEILVLSKGGNAGIAKIVRWLQNEDGFNFDLPVGAKLYMYPPEPKEKT